MISGIEAGCLMRAQYLPSEVISMLSQEMVYMCVLVLPPFVQNQALGSPPLCRKNANEIEEHLIVCCSPIQHLDRIAKGDCWQLSAR